MCNHPVAFAKTPKVEEGSMGHRRAARIQKQATKYMQKAQGNKFPKYNDAGDSVAHKEYKGRQTMATDKLKKAHKKDRFRRLNSIDRSTKNPKITESIQRIFNILEGSLGYRRARRLDKLYNKKLKKDTRANNSFEDSGVVYNAILRRGNKIARKATVQKERHSKGKNIIPHLLKHKF